jgi:predicted metal-dependent enzyme (double-stranded beta helix superfamily)
MSSGLSRRTFLATVVGAVAAGSGSTRASGNVNAKFEVDRFTDDVKRARLEADSQAAVQEVLRRAVAEPNAVLAGIGEPTEAGIHTIHRSADLTILNVVWAPLMVLLPHNHNMWASIGIYTGREDNILWERRGPVIEATGASALSEKEVFGLGNDAIHSVTNPIRRRTGALHIYGGDFFAAGRSAWDAETLRERPFDVEEARRQFREANDRFETGR